jgi:pentatricopeptide repeat protein
VRPITKRAKSTRINKPHAISKGRPPQSQQQSDHVNLCAGNSSVLFCKAQALQYNKEIDQDVIRSSFFSDAFVGTTFVDMYFKYGVIEDASRVLNEMIEQDLLLSNAMIAGYTNSGRIYEALHLFQKISQRYVVSWNS